LKRKMYGRIGPQGRMSKVRVSMARLLTVVNERQKILNEYRKSLEEEYIVKKQAEYVQAMEEQNKGLGPDVPKISFDLLRAKYHDLKRGIDNLDYIKEAVEITQKRKDLKTYLDEKYDYKNKKVVKPGQDASNVATLNATDSSAVIQGFQSGIIDQLNSGRFKISQEEVLRSHIKNWRMLNLKQKRKVLGILNARRAKDAKQEFLKELNLLGQKVQYDKQKKRERSTSRSICIIKAFLLF